MEDLTGKQFGQYQVTAPLGEGGMATVYKCYQPSMERFVALKILPRHFASDPNFVQRFRREAKVIASLEHPNILPVYDFGEAEGYTYLVMRYVEGKTLADLIHGQPLALPQISRFITQIAEALDYAHSRGVVHRDVKPGNVLLDERLNCLLSDFGLAKVLISASQFTTSGAFLGTPTYASPEQCLGRELDQRSDIYSLGVMLYEMAVGRPPFHADTPMGIVVKHIHDPLPMPRKQNPAVPEPVERVILKALAKHPDDRHQSAGEMAKTLAAALEQGKKTEQATVGTSTEYPPPPQEGIPPAATPQPSGRGTPDQKAVPAQGAAAAPTAMPTKEAPLQAKAGQPARRPLWIWAAGCLGLLVLVAITAVLAISIYNALAKNGKIAFGPTGTSAPLAAGPKTTTTKSATPPTTRPAVRTVTATSISLPEMPSPIIPVPQGTPGSSTISVLRSFDAPGVANSLAWDGANLWVAEGEFAEKAQFLKLDENGATQKVYISNILMSIEQTGLTWVGDSLWFYNDKNLYQFKIEGDNLNFINNILSPLADLSVFSSQTLAWDGANFWLGRSVYVLQMSLDGSIVNHFIYTQNTDAFAWDGAYLWVFDSGDLVALNLEGGCQPISRIESPVQNIRSLVWDGQTLWALANTSIYQLDMQAARTIVDDQARRLAETSALFEVLQRDTTTQSPQVQVRNNTSLDLTITFQAFNYVVEIPPGNTQTIAPPDNNFSAEVPGLPAVKGSYPFDIHQYVPAGFTWTFTLHGETPAPGASPSPQPTEPSPPISYDFQNWTQVQSFPAPASGSSVILHLGDSLWMVASGRIYQLSLAGDILSEAETSISCANPAWDGQSLWCGSENRLEQYAWPGGALLAAFNADLESIAGVTWDGEALWILGSNGDLVRYDRSGKRLKRLAVTGHTGSLTDLLYIEGELWVIDIFGYVVRYDNGFNSLGWFAMCGVSFPYEASLFWDGTSLWTADSNNNRITQCQPGILP